jgi:hypothetical protein
MVDEAIEHLTADRSRILARLTLTSSASLARWWTLVDRNTRGSPAPRVERVLAPVLLFTSAALADQVAQSEIDVIDGSTVRVHGQLIHIVGIETRKLGQKAHCGLERMLAARATSRLRQIVRSGERIEVEKVACSCRPGTDGSTVCNDFQNCGEVKVDGEDAGDILAHPYACGLHKCPRQKPWCPFDTE